MRQTSMSYMTALAGALLAGQVCYAIPTSLDTASIAARADDALFPGLYGSSGRPEIDDLVTAAGVSSGDLYVSTGGAVIISGEETMAEHSINLKTYNRVLFGFLKCQQAWVKSWFPNVDEMQKLKESYQLNGDETVFLRYNESDSKRHPVIVSRGWANTPVSVSPWWSWAALQGAYGDKPQNLQMADLVMAISGEKLVPVKVDNKDDYWKTLVDGHKTPIWVEISGGWFIVMSTQGQGPEDGSVTLAQLVGQVYDVPKRFSEWRYDISEVYILEGLPTFTEGQERKGEIAY